jgi:TPR repeat protein
MDLPSETDHTENAREHRSGPWKLIALVAAVTFIGVLLVPGEAPQQKTEAISVPGQADDTVTERPSLLDRPQTAEPDAALPTAADQGQRPGVKARQWIADLRQRNEYDTERVFEVARQTQAQGEQTDAYLLYFFAARDGHAGAALALGTQADPAHRDPDNSVFEQADLSQAFKWYKAAAERGNAEAGQRLSALQKTVQDLAAAGDENAQRLSLYWQ